MKITMVVPFIDQPEITRRCIEVLAEHATQPTELLVIDNDSDKSYEDELKEIVKGSTLELLYVHNDENIGVLPTFKQGMELASGDVICFIHNDVLIHEPGWDAQIALAFAANSQLGLAGLFGGKGVGENGGRIRPQSKMLGIEWGHCECHAVAWQHHSEYLDGLSPAAVLDGVGMFFSRKAADSLLNSDIFADWRAPHHFYDRIIPLKLIDSGFKVATIGLGFDHWSGATANSSEKYAKTGQKWLESQGHYVEGVNIDKQIYDIAERQFFDEFGNRLPVLVDADWNYEFRGLS